MIANNSFFVLRPFLIPEYADYKHKAYQVAVKLLKESEVQ